MIFSVSTPFYRAGMPCMLQIPTHGTPMRCDVFWLLIMDTNDSPQVCSVVTAEPEPRPTAKHAQGTWRPLIVVTPISFMSKGRFSKQLCSKGQHQAQDPLRTHRSLLLHVGFAGDGHREAKDNRAKITIHRTWTPCTQGIQSLIKCYWAAGGGYWFSSQWT